MIYGLGKKKAKVPKPPPINPLSLIPPDNSAQIIRTAVIVAGGAVIFYLLSTVDFKGMFKKKAPAGGVK